MKKENRFSPLESLGISVGFVAVIFLLTWIIGFTFETNDDYHISTIISRPVGEWCPYVSKLITIPLQILDKHTTANLWTWLNLILIGTSLGCTVYVLSRNIDRTFHPYYVFLYPMCLGTLGIFVLYLNYTRTVFSVVVGAGAMLLFSVFGEPNKAERILMYILGLIGIPLAVLVRDSPAFLAVAFLGVITATLLIVFLVRDHSSAGVKAFFSHSVLMLLPVLLMGGAVFVSNQMLTQEEKEFNEFNNARTAVVDYLGSYPSYDDYRGAYDSLGISSVDYLIMRGWNYSDTEKLTKEKYENFGTLKTFNAIGADKILSYSRYVLSTENYILPFLLIAFFFVLYDPKSCLLPVAVGFLATAAMIFYLKSSGRMPQRVYVPAAYTAAIFSVIGGMMIGRFVPNERRYRGSSRIIIAASLAAFIAGTPIAEAIHVETNKYQSLKAAYAYMGEQDDKTFAIYETSIRRDYIYDPWQKGNIDYYDNVLNLNGWLCRLPQWEDRLNEVGIDNPSRALFERDDVYATFDAIVYSFLRENYGEDITASEVFKLPEEFGWIDEHFVRYTKSREAIKDADVDSLTVNDGIINIYNIRESELLGKVNSVEKDLNLYCHLICEDEVLTYALNCESDGSFNGILYDVPLGVSLDEQHIEFFWA